MTVNTISDSVVFFFEQSNEPWGMKDKNSKYLYANKAYFNFFDIPYDLNELKMKSYHSIHSFKPLADKLIAHDQEVMLTKERHEAIGTTCINGNYRTFLFEKWPRFSTNGDIIGTIFHIKPFELISMSYFIDKPFYGAATYLPPAKEISPREWDVMFLLFRRMDKKQIAKLLKLKETSVRNIISRLYLKSGTTKKQDLLNHGCNHGWHLYIPPRFAQVSYDLLSNKS